MTCTDLETYEPHHYVIMVAGLIKYITFDDTLPPQLRSQYEDVIEKLKHDLSIVSNRKSGAYLR